MSRTILLLLLPLLALQSVAQDSLQAGKARTGGKMSLEISGGYSMPFGVYASGDMDNDRAGFATGGWTLQAGFGWMGGKNLGLAIQYVFQRNGLNDPANKVYPLGYPDSLNAGNWSNHYLMFGPMLAWRFGDFTVDARFTGGLVVSASSQFYTPDPYDTTGYSYTENVGAGFGYQLSVSAGYDLAPRLTLRAGVGLLGGWPMKTKQYAARYLGVREYKDPVTGVIEYEDVYSAPVEYEIKKTVAALNPFIGLVIRL